jgi:hypothetical protein
MASDPPAKRRVVVDIQTVSHCVSYDFPEVKKDVADYVAADTERIHKKQMANAGVVYFDASQVPPIADLERFPRGWLEPIEYWFERVEKAIKKENEPHYHIITSRFHTQVRMAMTDHNKEVMYWVAQQDCWSRTYENIALSDAYEIGSREVTFFTEVPTIAELEATPRKIGKETKADDEKMEQWFQRVLQQRAVPGPPGVLVTDDLPPRRLRNISAADVEAAVAKARAYEAAADAWRREELDKRERARKTEAE